MNHKINHLKISIKHNNVILFYGFISAFIFLPFRVLAQESSNIFKQIELQNKVDFIPYTTIYETQINYTVYQIDSLLQNKALPIRKQTESMDFLKNIIG